jgi:hypothetical protein
MKRRPFLFALSFCIPVFCCLAAGAGRPIVRVAPSLAVTPPAPGPLAPKPGVGRYPDQSRRFSLIPAFQDEQGFPVRIGWIEITVEGEPGSAVPPEVTRVPLVRDPLWTVPFTIPPRGSATLCAISEDGWTSEPKTISGPAPARGCLRRGSRTEQVRHTFLFRAK